MNCSLFKLAAETFTPVLRNLSHLLDKAAQHAADKQIDPAQLVAARLAPDMYPLGTQVQISCEMALNTMARLQGQTSPAFSAKELTIEQLKAHIAQTIEQLAQLSEPAFADAETRDIKIPIPNQPMVIEFDGLHLIKDWGFPNFYFHVVTAYAILRNQGVVLGKPDYMQHVGKFIRPAA